MLKDSFYFPHDYNARNDEKVLELRSIFGAEGYGVFWMIIETMAENSNGGVKASLLGGLSVSYGMAKGRLVEMIQFCLEVGLFFEKDGFYFSKRLLEHKAERKYLSDKGKEGAEKRRKNKENREKQTEANRGAIREANSGGIRDVNTKESKGKESKGNLYNGGSVDFSVTGIGELHVNVSSCEGWQWEELKGFLTQSENEFQTIAMRKPELQKPQVLEKALQTFTGMIQEQGNYKAAREYKAYFSNWLSSGGKRVDKVFNNGQAKKLSINDFV